MCRKPVFRLHAKGTPTLITCALAAIAAFGTSVSGARAAYCDGNATGFSCDFDEYISNVTVGVINNNSVCGPGYEDYTAQSYNAFPGGSLPISVTVSTWFAADQVRVFCDWDQNEVLDDLGEVTILTAAGGGANQLYTGTISVPISATLGSTRMRVRLNWNAPPPPCGDTTYGNIEDYTVIVVAAPSEGACCTGNDCNIVPTGTCTGEYYGDGSICGPNTCVAACCHDLICEDKNLADCTALSGSWNQNQACAPGGSVSCSYCTAGSTTNDEFISRVTVTNIDSITGAYPPGGYKDSTATVGDVSPGQNYPVTVLCGPPNYTGDQCTIWADWNRDGDFTDVDEQIAPMAGSPGTGPYTGTLAVPPGALIGSTRMRVRINWNAAPPPCGSTTYGSTEDFTLNVSLPVNPIVTNPLAVPPSGNVGDSTQLTANVALATPPFPIASVNVDLTAINGNAAEPMFDDGLHGDGGPNDGLWGVSATVQPATTPGIKTLPVTATDTNGGIGTANITYSVCGGFPESFDGTAGLPACWVSVNNSPGGPGTNPNWNQTDGAGTFPPHTGTGFVAANFNSSTGANDISNYLMSPVIPAMKNGDHVKFWTRSINSTFPDRMSLMISTNGVSTDPADFQANPAQVVINPTLVQGGYPGDWTEFDIELTGITGTVSGRIAFWYNVTNAGPLGANSDYIGVDDVEYIVGTAACTCYGDINADTLVDGSDIAGFAACVISAGGAGCDCADMDHDLAVSVADIPGFVTAVLAGGCGP